MCVSPIHIRNPYYCPPREVVRVYKYDSFGRKCTIAGKPVELGVRVLYDKFEKRISGTGRAFFKSDTQFIDVPCGSCPECARAHQRNFVQRSQMESLWSYDFMATLTYDDEHLPHLVASVPLRSSSPSSHDPSSYSDEYIDLSDFGLSLPDYPYCDIPFCGFASGDGERFELNMPFADVHDLQLLIKRLRDNVLNLPEFAGRKLSYLAVSELGSERGRPHFHVIFKVSKLASDFVNGVVAPIASRHVLKPGVIESLESILYNKVREFWSVNIGSRKNPIYEPRFTFRKKYVNGRLFKNYDLHWVDPLSASKTVGVVDVTYYVTKYALKDNPHEIRRRAFFFSCFDHDVAKYLYRQVRSRLVVSKGFGLNASFVFSLNPFLGKLTRSLLADSAITSRILRNSTLDVKKVPYPVFIDENGKHSPLCSFYRKRGDCFNYFAFLDVNFGVTKEMEDAAVDRLTDSDFVLSVFSRRQLQQKLMFSHMSFEDSLRLAGFYNSPSYG